MQDNIQPVKTIYFPRTHFTSTRWLKTALLYWEAVLRIVPDDFTLHDPPDVHALASEGLIENVSPERYRAGASSRFLRSLHGALQSRADGPSPCSPGRDGAGQNNYKIFLIGKIERGLLKELQAHGLAAATADWVTMASDIADLYLVGLADEIARDLNAAPSSDPSIDDVPAAFLALQQVRGEPTADMPVDGYACARMMAVFGLLESSHLPVAKLLRARQKYAEERRAFRGLVQGRVAAIAGLRSAQAIDAHVRDLGFELESAAASEHRNRSASQWRHAGRVVGVGAPASIGAVVTLSGAPAVVAALGGVGSVAAGITDWYVERRKVSHASNYLVSLETLAAGLRHADPRSQLTRLD
jgi:hypothetical protein